MLYILIVEYSFNRCRFSVGFDATDHWFWAEIFITPLGEKIVSITVCFYQQRARKLVFSIGAYKNI